MMVKTIVSVCGQQDAFCLAAGQVPSAARAVLACAIGRSITGKLLRRFPRQNKSNCPQPDKIQGCTSTGFWSKATVQYVHTTHKQIFKVRTSIYIPFFLLASSCFGFPLTVSQSFGYIREPKIEHKTQTFYDLLPRTYEDFTYVLLYVVRSSH